jgi:hypothetical protein
VPNSLCFSYPPSRGLNRDAVQLDVPGLRRMPGSCFSYSAAAPLGIMNRNSAQPGPDDHPSLTGGHSGFVSSACMTYPVFACFRY